MKIAVTGATGFLGKRLCLRLRELGHDVYEYNSKNLDLTQPVDLPGSIDVLYHLAANARVFWAKKEPFADFTVNALGTLNILEASCLSGIKKIIYISTDLVYQNFDSCRETDAVGENKISGPYGFTKLIGEYYVRYYAQIYGLDYVILRPSSYYGPGMKKNAIFDMIHGFLRDKKVNLFHHIDSQFDFIYIEDVVEALVMSMDWKNEIVNVSTGCGVPLGKLYNMIKAIIGYEAPLTYKDELIRICVDNSKLKRLGWRQKYSLEEGLKKTIADFSAKNSKLN